MNENSAMKNENFIEYVVAARARDYERAKKFLRLCIASEPTEYDYYIHLAGIYSEEGEFRKAIFSLNRAGRLSPGGKSLNLSLAYCHDSLGSTSIARKIVEHELKKDQDSFFLKHLLMSILIKSGNHQKASNIAIDLLQHPEVDERKFIDISNALISLVDISCVFFEFSKLKIQSASKGVKDILEGYKASLINSAKSPDTVNACNIDEMERQRLWRQLPLSQHRKLLHAHDAYVGISSQSVMVRNHFCRDLCYHMEVNASSDIVSLSNVKFGTRNISKYFDVDEALFIGGGKNYYHWMVDYLPGLGILEQENLLKDVPVIFSGELNAFQKQSLEHIGFDLSRYLDPGDERVIHCAQLWATTRASKRKTVMGVPDWWQSEVEIETLSWLRNAFLTPQAGDGTKRTRKLYLSRGGARFRRLLNDGEVVELMRDAGYEVVHPEHLSVVEQAKLFSEASHVVGVHGAAFTNIVFMSPGARVMEIVGRYKPPVFYKKIAGILGISHDAIEVEIEKIHKKTPLQDPRFGDVSIEISDLKRRLSGFDDCFRR